MKGKLLGAAAAAAGLLWAGAAIADGAGTYAAKCKGCHGADGKGNATMKVPAFSSGDAAMKDVIAKGKGKMPVYGGKLSDAEIDEVVKYVKTLK